MKKSPLVTMLLPLKRQTHMMLTCALLQYFIPAHVNPEPCILDDMLQNIENEEEVETKDNDFVTALEPNNEWNN